MSILLVDWVVFSFILYSFKNVSGRVDFKKEWKPNLHLNSLLLTLPFLNYGKRSLEMFWKKLFQISNLHFCLLQLCKTVKSSFFFTVIMQNVNHLSQWKMSRLISSISIQIHFLLLKILNFEIKWNLSNFANSMSHQISKSNDYVWTILNKILIKLKDYF